MRLKLKLYAGLEKYLPCGSENNTTQIDISENSSVNAVLKQCNLPEDMVHLILLNGIYINPEQRDTINLFVDGDTLAVWPPVAGG